MRILLFLFVALGATTVIAQNKQVLYGLEEVPQSLLLNPGGKVKQQMHFGIPFLSQFHINGGSSGVSPYDIFGTTGEDINSKIERKLFEMSDKDFFTATQQWELFQFGWMNRQGIYFSGGVYQEFDFISYFPRDLAILAWEGNANYLDYPFDLGQLSATADLLTVYHFGINKALSNRLTVGGRFKVYSGIMNIRSTKNQGTFTTSLAEADGTNVYEHRLEEADIRVQTSGVASLENGFSVGDALGRALLGGSLGLGVDLGATYDINEDWTASMSFLDVGVMFQSKDVETYHAYGSYDLDGIELLFPPLSDGEPTNPYYDEFEDELEREVPIDTLTNTYTHMRPVKWNAGLKYQFGETASGAKECDCLNQGGAIDREQAVGVQLYSVFRPKGPQWAGTLFYYRRWFSFLASKFTYTVDSFSFTNIGLGIVGDFGKFNVYIAMDNIGSYGNLAKAKSVSLQLGFNLKFQQE